MAEVSAKRKEKEKKKQYKVVVRRLPKWITWLELAEQLAPLPPHDYVLFVPANMNFGPNAFARCYFSFLDETEVLEFAARFNGYVFVDSKGVESAAMVEIAPFQKIPKKKREDVGNDNRCGQIINEAEYKRFLNEIESYRNKSIISLEEQFRLVQLKQSQGKGDLVQETPLTQFIVNKVDEKYRRVDERRRQRDVERKARLRAYDEDRLERKAERERERAEKDKNDKGKEKNKERLAKPRVKTDVTDEADRLEQKRSDWDQFKKDFGLDKEEKAGNKEHLAKEKREGKEKIRIERLREREERENERRARRLKEREQAEIERKRERDEERESDNKESPSEWKSELVSAGGGTRAFGRPVRERPPRVDRVTAASKDPAERKRKDRPEREIYRPGRSRTTDKDKAENKLDSAVAKNTISSTGNETSLPKNTRKANSTGVNSLRTKILKRPEKKQNVPVSEKEIQLAGNTTAIDDIDTCLH